MKSKSFSLPKKKVFELCSDALKKTGCEIIEKKISDGYIEAKKGGGFFSYGHNITIIIKSNSTGKTKIEVTSNSIGIQIFDWGTNSENEEELIELIQNVIK